MTASVVQTFGQSNPTIALDHYRPQIEAALSYAGESHRYDDVASMVAAGTAQFWPGPASCIVTELIDYPRQRVVNVFLAGGTLPELEAMLPHILDWAKLQGCQSAVFTGRKGWGKTFLMSQGWTDPLVLFTKAL